MKGSSSEAQRTITKIVAIESQEENEVEMESISFILVIFRINTDKVELKLLRVTRTSFLGDMSFLNGYCGFVMVLSWLTPY